MHVHVFFSYTQAARSERLLEVIVSEMYGAGSRANRAAEREQREVERERVGARGGCMLIGAKWAADELKWFAM